MTKEQPTYHGVPIPDDLWADWNDPNASEISGWRRGVTNALRPSAAADLTERDRLGALAEERDRAEQAAWQAEYDRKRQGRS